MHTRACKVILGAQDNVKMHNSETQFFHMGPDTTIATIKIKKHTVGIPLGPLKGAAEFTLQQSDNISIGEVNIQRWRLG